MLIYVKLLLKSCYLLISCMKYASQKMKTEEILATCIICNLHLSYMKNALVFSQSEACNFFMYIIITDVLRRPWLLSTCFITYIVGVKQEIFSKSQALGSISNFRPPMMHRNTTQLQFKIEVVHKNPTLRGSGLSELSSSFWCYTAIPPYRQKLFVIQESLPTGSGLE